MLILPDEILHEAFREEVVIQEHHVLLEVPIVIEHVTIDESNFLGCAWGEVLE